MELDTFTRAYIECALWASTDENDEPLDIYDESDIAPDTLAEMLEDCEQFQESNAEVLDEAYATGHYSPERAGHDFWLTRNRHGAGFWDRGLGKIGDELTSAAKTFGSVDLYLGDDERIHA